MYEDLEQIAKLKFGKEMRAPPFWGWSAGAAWDRRSTTTCSLVPPSPEYPYPFDLRTGSYERLDWGTTSLEGRMKMTAKADSERFQSGAEKYAVYLETPEGRLRSDLAFTNLQDFLPLQAKPSLCALDVGCGTGATAVRLARLGIHVTVLDSSPAMLDIAKRAAWGSRGYGQSRTATWGRYAVDELVPHCIVRCNSVPQRTGISRRPDGCVVRRGSRLAGFISDTVSPCAEPGRRSIQGRYPSRRFGGCGK